jgi:hypothetical protein
MLEEERRRCSRRPSGVTAAPVWSRLVRAALNRLGWGDEGFRLPPTVRVG